MATEMLIKLHDRMAEHRNSTARSNRAHSALQKRLAGAPPGSTVASSSAAPAARLTPVRLPLSQHAPATTDGGGNALPGLRSMDAPDPGALDATPSGRRSGSLPLNVLLTRLRCRPEPSRFALFSAWAASRMGSDRFVQRLAKLH